MRVESIVVLRPNAVGDFVFALPALAALRHAWPRAQLVFLGKRWHAEFLPGRGVIDEVVELPRVRGVTADDEDPDAVEAFCARMRARRFDLAFQLFGGGGHSNAFLHRLGARRNMGLRAEGAAALDLSLPYVPLQNERLRLLEVVRLAGARAVDLAPRLAVLDRDRRELGERLALPAAPLAVLNPGATDPRRRWPAQCFAAVGDALARAGALVVVNGSPDELDVAAQVVASMQAPAVDAAGVLSLGGLVALLARARLVVSNDTGPLHLAQAVGTPTVGIYWLTNLFVSGPLESGSHRHMLAVRVHCPECGAENLNYRCPHDPSFVAEISSEAVMAQALTLWHERPGADTPRPARAASASRRGRAPDDEVRHPAAPSAQGPWK